MALPKSKTWPREGAPLLPSVYREAWYYETLPSAALERANLPQSLTMGRLDAEVWSLVSHPSNLQVIANHVLSLVTARLYFGADGDLATRRILRGEWDRRVVPAELPFATRTRNVLKDSGKLNDQKWLSTATAVDFFSLRNAGPITLLDFATVAEAFGATSVGSLDEESQEDDRLALRNKVLEMGNEFPIDRIPASDPRTTFLNLSGSSVVEALLLEVSQLASSQETLRVAAKIDRTRDVLRVLERQSIEEGLDSILDQLFQGNQKLSLASRLGWDGRGGCTLAEAGELGKLTRERVRQLEIKLRRKIKNKLYFPALDRALEILNSAAETLEPDAASLLLTHGVTKMRFLPYGVLTAADILHRRYSFEVADKNAVQLPGDQQLQPLQAALKSLVSLSYVTSVAELQARAESLSNGRILITTVRSFLNRHQNLVWLDSNHDWFWLRRGSGNRYVTAARKIVSVCGQITVEGLRDGILRQHHAKGSSLPRQIVAALCRAAELRVEGEMISSDRPLNPQESLSPIEKVLLDVLSTSENVATFSELRELCVGRGVNRHSFFVYLTYSPILQRVAPGIYALRGREVDPTRVAYLLGSYVPPPPALQDHGWTADNSIWLGYRVNRSLFDTGVFQIPGSVRNVVGDRKFELYTPDGTSVGQLTLRSSTGWGLGPFFTRRGVDLGDALVICLDTQLEMAVVQSGNLELLDNYVEGKGQGAQRLLSEATQPEDASFED